MNVRTYLPAFLWITPFLGFLCGYQVLKLFLHTDIVVAPSVVGCHLHEAIKNLSHVKLNVRILAEKEDNDLPEGIVLSQSPAAGQKIKSHQSVYLVITKKKSPSRVPVLYKMPIIEAERIAKDQHMELRVYGLESVAPTDTCIVQSILPGHAYNGDNLIIYTSRGTTPLRVMPNLKGKPLSEVAAFLDEQDLKFTVINGEDSSSSKGIVSDQRPLHGSLIDLTKPPIIQLKIILNI